jgi:hypothetical protein
MQFVPRAAELGLMVIALSPIVTLIVRIAGEFVVEGWVIPGVATTSATAVAPVSAPKSLPIRMN